MRLDEELVSRNLAPSRSRARDMVLRGSVAINGVPARKPSQTIQPTDDITIADDAQRYVSRAALKLVHALDHFNLSPQGKFCLDIGASTGGFTQVLLERGAKHVIALDVGHGQLHDRIANDPRVTPIEGQNARDLDLEILGLPSSRRKPGPRLSTSEPVESLGPGFRRGDDSGLIEFMTSDVSFISLKLALPPALALAVTGANLVALIKPQFEVGRERVPRDGVVKNPDLHAAVCADISRFVEGEGWSVLGIIASPIEGGDGNREFLLAATKK